jgi:hypothetical protein
MMAQSEWSSFQFDLQIPDPTRPYGDDERGVCGPSARLVPFTPQALVADAIVGRRIDELSPAVGTYGMGGPGFFGLRLGREWLVVAIWGAADWMSAAGRCVGDAFYDNYGRPKPWLADWRWGCWEDEFSRKVIGQCVRSLTLEPHYLQIMLEDGFELTIEEPSDRRPVYEGTGQPRVFGNDDDLRTCVFLSPTTELWV